MDYHRNGVLVGIYSATPMLGCKSGHKSWLQIVNPLIKWNYCTMHLDVLTTKQLNEDSNHMLKLLLFC